jgi:hypothetical protein
VTRLPPLSESARAQLAEQANRELSVEEWRAQAAIPLLPEEIEHTWALVRWFRGRYPTAADRLAYARRAYARWHRATAPARPGPRR